MPMISPQQKTFLYHSKTMGVFCKLSDQFAQLMRNRADLGVENKSVEEGVAGHKKGYGTMVDGGLR